MWAFSMRRPIHPTAERCTRFGNSKACNSTLCSFISDYFVIHLLVLSAFYLLSFIYDFPSKCYSDDTNPWKNAHGVWSRVEWDRQKEVIKLLTSVNNKFTLTTEINENLSNPRQRRWQRAHCCETIIWLGVSQRADGYSAVMTGD